MLPEVAKHRARVARPQEESESACLLTGQLVSKCQKGSQR